MKIALINGSPKIKDSASGAILHDLKPFLEKDNNFISEHKYTKPQLTAKDMEQIIENDVLVFAFPLYVDGIPAHLLNCLVQLESYFSNIKDKEIKVYVLVNCGFHEGKQNELAIEILENWCEKAGLNWGQGIGIGAGGMLGALKNVPIGKGPKKNLGKAFAKLSNNILNGISEEKLFITANFPRFLYKLAAEMGWRQSVKANGLTKKDLFLRK
jgi:multimeric flavodoxin WrbA